MQDMNQLLDKGLKEIQRLKELNKKLDQSHSEPIAIIGAACRYPGGIGSLEQLWQALQEGRDGIGRMTDQRWPMQRFITSDPHQPGGIYSDAMGMLDEIDQFDYTHFGLKIEEARHIDPQHRLLMELAWETFEDAGYAVDTFSGSRTGIYVGIMSDDYGQLQGPLEKANYYIGTGMAKSCAAGRLAFTFGLEGPALALDTACSSSLVGVHLAVQALRRNECDAALAGGVNLILSPQGTVVACRSQMLSPRGHCYTFDASADGYVRSEGCGLVLLKRLSDAVRDGDRIYALIRGSAVNHAGRSQGLTAPSGKAQRNVIAAAIKDAGVKPSEVTFVECHGTGTALGDPIEVRAVEASYVQGNEVREPLLLGALKSNLGHMEAAAGIGGLHKAIQVVCHRQVPKNLHFQAINPQIKVNLNMLHVPTEPTVLAAEGRVLAGVSSFGFSGTNVHLILESYDQKSPASAGGSAGFFRLAARSGAALAEYATRYLNLLKHRQDIDVPALCRTAATGRSEGEFRIAFSARDGGDLRACLEEYLDVAGGDQPAMAVARVPSLWIISGQTDVDWVLAKKLFDNRIFYRTTVQEAYAYLQPRCPHGQAQFEQLLQGGEQTTEQLPHAIHRLALAKLLMHLGIEPGRVAGFGFGEYIAASVAGLVEWCDVLDILQSGEVPQTLRLGRKRYDFVSTIDREPVLPDVWRNRSSSPYETTIDALARDFAARAGNNSGGAARIELSEGLELHLDGEVDERVFRWVHGQTNRDPELPLEGFLAQCYMAGFPLRWDSVFEDQPVRRLSLPGYPFQRERVWTQWPYSFDATLPSTVGNPALARPMGSETAVRSSYGKPLAQPHRILNSVIACPSGARNFSGELSLANLPYFAAHWVFGEITLPAAAYVDMIVAAGRWCWPDRPLFVDKLQLLRKCLPGDEPLDLYCHVRPAEGRVEIYSKARSSTTWQQHVRATVGVLEQDEQAVPFKVSLTSYQSLCTETIPVRRYYQSIAQTGLHYGADFQGIFELSRGERHALAKIALPPSIDQSLDGYLAHPILLDACLQAISAASRPNANDGLFVPAQIHGIRLYKPLPQILWCFVEITPANSDGSSSAALTMLDMQGERVMSIDRFETQRYIEEPLIRPTESYAKWIYEKHWVIDKAFESLHVDVTTDVTSITSGNANKTPGHWLLFSDQGIACDALEARLLAQGDLVSVICSGLPVKAGRLTASLTSSADVATLFASAEEAGPLKGAIYGWSLTESDPLEDNGYTHMLERCARDPLWLCQTVLEPRWRGVSLNFLTRGSQPAGEAPVIQPQASLLWGHVSSFINENGLYARLIDLDPEARDNHVEAELVARTLDGRGEFQFAIRRGQRLLARLRPQPDALAGAPVQSIDAEASYLISGGFGSLGIETARELVRQGARHIILIGRDISKGERHSALTEFHAVGANIHPLQADISDEASLAPRLAALLRTLPPLKGVVHAAGVLADGTVARQTWEQYLNVFSAKVGGTLNLYRAVSDQPLDFFIMYSSAAAILGNPGQANYAAANSFMDSFAWYLRGCGRSGLSINWGGWSETGMAADYGVGKANKDLLVGSIPVAQGLEVIRRQFAIRNGQFAVIPLHLNVLSGNDKMPYLRSLLSDMQGTHQRLADAVSDNKDRSSSGFGVLTRFARANGNERRVLVKQYLNTAIGTLLNQIGTLDDRQSLFDLGLDSLLSIDLRQILERDLDCSFASTLLHDYPTIDLLTDFLLDDVVGHGAGHDTLSPIVEKAAAVTAKVELPRRAMPPQPTSEQDNDIAIIGVSGRYPGAVDLQTFWESLREGRDAITEIPSDRWNHEDYFDHSKDRTKIAPNKSYGAWGGFIEGVDQFDPAFFNISPRMAAFIDPKERLFLETVWNLLEEAACTREHMRQVYDSRVGVFVGAMYQLYGEFAADDNERAATALSSYNAIAHRTSYFFDLCGPSLAVDTMCSSSLTAVHLACQSLLDGGCELAIAGGVNLSIHPQKYVSLSQAQIIGSHPGSRSFCDGDGFLPAEGVGAVLLKPLAKARLDGDHILAVIKASSINHGGRSTGFYAPNALAQVQLMEDNFRKAGVDPASISYVEAAANGTPLGDSVELKALSRVYGGSASRPSCPIGTVKSNIGHAEAASGIAQLTKVILQLKHRMLVPTLKVGSPNPNIDFAQTPFHLLERCTPWLTDDGQPRRAAISSFGAGGANAHLIVEEFVPAQPDPSMLVTTVPVSEIVVLSARTIEQLKEVVRRLLAHLTDAACHTLSLANIAHTLQTGKEEMDCRLALLVNNFDELRNGLCQYLGASKDESALLMYNGNVQDQPELRQLLSGKAGEEMVQELLADRQLEKLMLHWVQGGKVPWQLLRGTSLVKHVVLPTYPFARSRFWLSGGGELKPTLAVQSVADALTFTSVVEIENALTTIWKELLGLEQIGRHQNFFELGGDSQFGMHVIARVRDIIQVDLPLASLYEAPTVAQMSEKIAFLAASATPFGDCGADEEYEEGII